VHYYWKEREREDNKRTCISNRKRVQALQGRDHQDKSLSVSIFFLFKYRLNMTATEVFGRSFYDALYERYCDFDSTFDDLKNGCDIVFFVGASPKQTGKFSIVYQ